MAPTSYAILGTGALGGFYGARLERAGSRVHFLLRRDYDHVRAHGLRVKSKDGDFHLPKVRAFRDVAEMPRCDVAIVTWKAVQNHLLPTLLPPVLKEDGVVLVLQNGLGVEEAAAQATPGHQVFGGLCFLCSNRVGPGHIHHLDYGAIRMAAYDPEGGSAGIPDTLRTIGADFERAGIKVGLLEDLTLARWQKLVWNIPFNGLSVVLDADTSELMANPDALGLVMGLMGEVLEGAAACGRTIPVDFIRSMLDLTRTMPPYKASMKIDFDERRPMEVEAIHGAPLRAAAAAGVQLPLLKTLYHQLKFMEARRVLRG